MKIEDSRLNAIAGWLTPILGVERHDMVPASSDASFRRYFRIQAGHKSYVVMDAPPERENIRPFMQVARLLRVAGVRVPQIFHYDAKRGFMLLEDFGSECYLDRLAYDDPDIWYQRAFDSLFNLQSNTLTGSSNLPGYDVALLTRELGIFYEWFLGALLKLETPDALLAPLNEVLIGSALQQPQTVVHRDFHSRNLMALQSGSPGVIDFQDAVIGPITYDLVSLLKDCYIAWPVERVDVWRDQYWHRLQQAGLLNVGQQQFKKWFDLMGLQRHLKAIGIFSRLHLRDGKSGYLADIPRTMGYVLAVAKQYPELTPLLIYLKQQVLPVYEQVL